MNAFWNAASWSGSSCWTNLSAIPICFSQASVISAVTISPQSPYSVIVSSAATATRCTSPRTPIPAWKSELMIAPRAVCSRRLRPSSAIRSASGSTAVSTASSSTMLAGVAGWLGHPRQMIAPNRAATARQRAAGAARRRSPAARAGGRAPPPAPGS